ncbi:MAG: hypothetical protein CME64_03845 [Halobacteriovoraceae bacterium]|nr:hypothetical protein [Halobacteriovoraceae bacterium]|tara:strand:- start:46956 stop:47612 length:657 start_codon:yes stop_codon:yes gene_type:complete
MKLHLGCGQRHLEGYRNIDFPLNDHSVQIKSVADEHADIRRLRFKKGEVREVRLHHVFEHFSRPVACGLASGWSSWMEPGDKLRIEVPDYLLTTLSILNPLSSFRRKMVGIRHLFGSHEAHWAYHYEGYTTRHLLSLLRTNDFKLVKKRRNSWKGTYNIDLTVEKVGKISSKEDFEKHNRAFLRNFLLDDSEIPLLDIWMKDYQEQLELSWAQDESVN